MEHSQRQKKKLEHRNTIIFRGFYTVNRLVREMFIVAAEKKLQITMCTQLGWVAGFHVFVCLFLFVAPVGST